MVLYPSLAIFFSLCLHINFSFYGISQVSMLAFLDFSMFPCRGDCFKLYFTLSLCRINSSSWTLFSFRILNLSNLLSFWVNQNYSSEIQFASPILLICSSSEYHRFKDNIIISSREPVTFTTSANLFLTIMSRIEDLHVVSSIIFWQMRGQEFIRPLTFVWVRFLANVRILELLYIYLKDC